MSHLIASRALRALSFRCYSAAAMVDNKIGNREVVGYGYNGLPSYQDRPDFPLPAVRFRTITPDLQVLKQKEKGDWKALSVAEKKTLYRASFCQTLAEVQAPTGEWKSITGWTLVVCSLAVWVMLFFKAFVLGPLPDSFKEENRRAQLRRMLDLKIDPITGLSSKWDYEKDDWKK